MGPWGVGGATFLNTTCICLKKYVRNWVKRESCTTSWYMYDETFWFTTKYFALYPHTTRWIWDANEEEADVGHVLVGNGKLESLSPMEM